MSFTISLTSAFVKSDPISRLIADPPGSFHVPVGSLEVQSNGYFKVATGSSGVALNFGGVSVAKVVILRPDQDITVVLNGADAGFKILKDKMVSLLGVEVTSIAISNSSNHEVVLSYYLAG